MDLCTLCVGFRGNAKVADKMNRIEEVVGQVIEAIKRPGVMSLAGVQAERRCSKLVTQYFKILGARVKMTHLEQLTALKNKQQARHYAEMKVRQIARRLSDTLQVILKENIHAAILVADKQQILHEAPSADITVGPASGMLSADAEKYAIDQAAQQVVGINDTTVEAIADLVADAVGGQATPAELSRDLRDLLDDWTKNRADLVARTEMADAFGFAALERLKREEIEYKQLILSPDACEICQSIADNGPVPVDEPFVDDDGEEYERSPIHPRCRCATVGARAPLVEGFDPDEARNEKGEWSSEGEVSVHDLQPGDDFYRPGDKASGPRRGTVEKVNRKTVHYKSLYQPRHGYSEEMHHKVYKSDLFAVSGGDYKAGETRVLRNGKRLTLKQ